MNVVLDNVDLVLKAFTYTVLLFLVAGVLSMIGGVVLVALRVGPVGVLRVAAGVYVTVVRNTPLLVIFLFFAIAAPKIGLRFTWVDVHIGQFDFTQYFAGGVVALTLYTSCFVCEALRSGINAVPLGQAEAARAIGLPFGSVMTQIVLPQAIRASVPAGGERPDRAAEEHHGGSGVRTDRGGRADALLHQRQRGPALGDLPGLLARLRAPGGDRLAVANRLERRWRIA